MKRLRLALVVLIALAALWTAVPMAEASHCPIYQVCMKTYPEGYCLCPGFYCHGQFICGIPIYP